MARGWGLALLALSVGLNLGLAVAVVQQRLQRAPAPAAMAAPTVAPAPPAASVEASAETQAPAPAPAPRTPVVREAPPVTPERPPGTRETLEPFGEPPAEDLRPDAAFPGFRGPSPARLEELAERLGVPAEDRPRFIALQRSFIAATRERRQQLELVRREMKSELLAGSPDASRLRALVDTSAQLQAGLERALVEHVLAARQVLHGDAERRYLALLAQLGPRLTGPRPGPTGMPPRWQERQERQRWNGTGPGWRRGGGGFMAPREPTTAPEPSSPTTAPTPSERGARAPSPATGIVEASATGLPPG